MKKITISLLILSIIIGIIYCYPKYREYDKRIWLERLLLIPDVKSVKSYYDYEGTKYATLALANKNDSTVRLIGISHFDSSLFSSMDGVVLENINDLILECTTIKNNPNFGAVDILLVELMIKSPSRVKLQNISDVVQRFDDINNYIKSFPTNPENAKVVNMDSRVDRNKDHWCHIKRVSQ